MKLLSLAIWSLGILCTVFFIGQDQFNLLWPTISLSFLGYTLVVGKYTLSTREIWILGIGLRILLLPSFPLLSDDIYRYLWDGLTIVNGIGPYSFTPIECQNIIQRNDLLKAMNSASYNALYPTIPQFVFGVMSKISGGHIITFTLLLKGIFLITEAGILYFLFKILPLLNISSDKSALYFFNPLVIIEVMGNAHFEVLMTLPLLACIYYALKNKAGVAGILLGISTAAKLLPAMFVPIITLHFLRAKKGMTWAIILLFTLLILFTPVVLSLFFSTGFIESADLFFSKFEFNASIYFLFRWIGWQIYGYNAIAIIGPLLSIIGLCMILYISWKKGKKENKWIEGLLWIILIYLFTSTTVHPWYLVLTLRVSDVE